MTECSVPDKRPLAFIASRTALAIARHSTCVGATIKDDLWASIASICFSAIAAERSESSVISWMTPLNAMMLFRIRRNNQPAIILKCEFL